MNDHQLENVYNDRNLVGYTNFRMMIDRFGGFEEYMQAGPPAALADHDDIMNDMMQQIQNRRYQETRQQLGTILLSYRQNHAALLADFNEAADARAANWMNLLRINNNNNMNVNAIGGKTRSFYKSRRAHRKHKKSNRSCSKKNRTRRSYLKNKKSNKK